MPGDLYRDAHVGIGARLTELVARIRERESRLTDEVWDTVDDALLHLRGESQAALEQVRGDDDAMSFEEMTRLESVLSSWSDELERLIDSLPAVEADWGITPDDVDDPPVPKTMSTSYPDALRELRAQFEAVVQARHPLAKFAQNGVASFIARFRERGVPISLRATALEASELGVEECQMTMQTSVRRSMPRISLQHETFFNTFGKAFGVRQEIEVGEPSFDGLFLIQGDENGARTFLVPNTRGLLLQLARFDVPRFEIDPPQRVARVSWRFEPNLKAFELAMRVLLAVRDLESEVHFLRQ